MSMFAPLSLPTVMYGMVDSFPFTLHERCATHGRIALADLEPLDSMPSRYDCVTFENCLSYHFDLLLDRERPDFTALNGEVIIGADWAPRKSSRYFHAHDYFRIVAFYTERLEPKFVFLDRLHNPVLDRLLAAKIFSFVPDERIVRKAGN